MLRTYPRTKVGIPSRQVGSDTHSRRETSSSRKRVRPRGWDESLTFVRIPPDLYLHLHRLPAPLAVHGSGVVLSRTVRA